MNRLRGTSPAIAVAELLAGREHVDVVSAMTPQQPTRLLAALLRGARTRGVSVTLHVADLTGRFDFLSDEDVDDVKTGRLGIRMLAGGCPRSLASLVDSYPLSLWETDRLLRSGAIPCDVYAVRAVRADQGYELGNGVGFTPSLASRRGVRCAIELAPPGEYSHGLFPTPAEWWGDEVCAADPARPGEAGPEREEPRPDAVRDRIADHVGELIPSGSTLEVGLGGVADALATRLRGAIAQVHTGVVPTSFRESGGRTPDDGIPITATSLAVDAGGAAWRSPPVLLPISATHDPATLAGLPSLWGVNSGYSVDVTGNVNAEWLGDARVSVGGGQRDFTRAAHAAEDGGSIIALPSRTPSGRARIVPALVGHQVTTSTSDVDFVVTEWGIADLRGRSLSERAEAVVAIAHPEDRSGLAAALPVQRTTS